MANEELQKAYLQGHDDGEQCAERELEFALRNRTPYFGHVVECTPDCPHHDHEEALSRR